MRQAEDPACRPNVVRPVPFGRVTIRRIAHENPCPRSCPRLRRRGRHGDPRDGTVRRRGSFTGPRVELHGGWNWLGAHTRTDDGTTTTHATDHDNDGFFGGQVGYDYAIRGNTVVGVFGSYDVSNNKECATAGTTTGCFKANRNIEAGARVGEVFGGTNLVYLKGAYVNGKFGASATDNTTNTYISDHEKLDGWRAGIGVEHQLGKYAYAKLEYNYSRYNRFHGELGPEDVSVRVNRQEALAGIGFRF